MEHRARLPRPLRRGRAAAKTGTRFVDTYPSTLGHDACQPVGTRWIEPLTNPINAAPIHPNPAGGANMTRQVLRQVIHQATHPTVCADTRQTAPVAPPPRTVLPRAVSHAWLPELTAARRAASIPTATAATARPPVRPAVSIA